MLFDEEVQPDRVAAGPRAPRQSRGARARIRTLLAMEAHVEPETQVSSKDVNRGEKGIKAGQARSEVFPRLDNVAARVRGTGVTLTVHFTKKAGAAVRYVSDESAPAAAVREVDLAWKLHLSSSDLAAKVSSTPSRSTALRRHLGIGQDSGACHVFAFDSQRIARFSDNAYRAMKDAVDTLDTLEMDAVAEGHKPTGGRSAPRTCTAERCAA